NTLVVPLSLADLEARGLHLNVSNIQNVVVQANSCRSECALPKPDCSGHGKCQEGAAPGQMQCQCEPGRGGQHCEISDCSNPSTPDGALCDDGNACTANDTCQAGTCQPGTPTPVDDGNACTIDSCDPTTGVNHAPEPFGTICDVGRVCRGTSCDPRTAVGT